VENFTLSPPREVDFQQWYHHPMIIATAQAFSNIALVKFTLAKLDRTNSQDCPESKGIHT